MKITTLQPILPQQSILFLLFLLFLGGQWGAHAPAFAAAPQPLALPATPEGLHTAQAVTLEHMAKEKALAIDVLLEERLAALQVVATVTGRALLKKPEDIEQTFRAMEAAIPGTLAGAVILGNTWHEATNSGSARYFTAHTVALLNRPESSKDTFFISDIQQTPAGAEYFILAVQQITEEKQWWLATAVEAETLHALLQGQPGLAAEAFLVNKNKELQTPSALLAANHGTVEYGTPASCEVLFAGTAKGQPALVAQVPLSRGPWLLVMMQPTP